MQPRQRLYEIDALRFFAAGAVLLFHYLFAGNSTGDMELPIQDQVEYFARYGFLGVDLFFLISGFVIAMSMQHGNAARFLLDRLIRLYPVFLAAVLLTATVRTVWGGEGDDISLADLLLNLTMFAGIFEQQLDLEFVDGVYWSLMVELQFYFLMLLVLLVRQLNRLEPILIGWLLLTLVSDHIATPGWLDTLLVLEWSPNFIAGALFYRVYTHGTSLLRLTALATCMYLSIDYGIWHLDLTSSTYDEEFNIPTVVTLIAGGYLLMALLVNNHLRWMRKSWLVWLGGLTYPLYLVHQNVGYALFRQLDDWGTPAQLLATVTGVVLLVSLLMHLVLERALAGRMRATAHAWLARRSNSSA